MTRCIILCGVGGNNMAVANIKERFREATETGKAKVHELESEAQKIVQRLMEKGRDAQNLGKQRLDDLRAPFDRVKEADLFKRAKALREEVEARFEGGMDRVLEALGVVTRADIEKIEKRLSALSKKVADLHSAHKKARAAKARKA
jgi:polyhydroxyalkanoate synthesis regulator phasin